MGPFLPFYPLGPMTVAVLLPCGAGAQTPRTCLHMESPQHNHSAIITLVGSLQASLTCLGLCTLPSPEPTCLLVCSCFTKP